MEDEKEIKALPFIIFAILMLIFLLAALGGS